jgi:3-deoxy-D-manno-octulosonic acid (KDO) 8-phosphate synthase
MRGRGCTAIARLHSGSRRRRLSRLSAVAVTALVVPVALLVTGLHQLPASARADVPRTVKVVRVTKVVKVVQHAPVQRPAR